MHTQSKENERIGVKELPKTLFFSLKWCGKLIYKSMTSRSLCSKGSTTQPVLYRMQRKVQDHLGRGLDSILVGTSLTSVIGKQRAFFGNPWISILPHWTLKGAALLPHLLECGWMPFCAMPSVVGTLMLLDHGSHVGRQLRSDEYLSGCRDELTRYYGLITTHVFHRWSRFTSSSTQV